MAKKTMCKNCDGLIDFDVIACPYCGSEVSFNKEESLFPPPYPSQEEKEPLEENVKEKNISKFPFFLFSLGLNISFFGVFLLLFSSKGKVFLSWNAKLWFLYLILGIPLMLLANKLRPKED